MDTTRPFPPGNLRVSDADRDRALAELSEHFQAGRLTSEEFGERSDLALQARTGADLAALLADLPRPQASGPPAPQAGTRPPARGLAGSRSVVLAVGAVTAVVAVAAITAGLNGGLGGHGAGVLVPVLIVLLVIRRLASPGRRRGYPGTGYEGRSRDIHDN
jgi:hypothetical protein